MKLVLAPAYHSLQARKRDHSCRQGPHRSRGHQREPKHAHTHLNRMLVSNKADASEVYKTRPPTDRCTLVRKLAACGMRRDL